MSLFICLEANTKASSLSAAALNELLVRLDIQINFLRHKNYILLIKRSSVYVQGLTAKHHQYKLSSH